MSVQFQEFYFSLQDLWEQALSWAVGPALISMQQPGDVPCLSAW